MFVARRRLTFSLVMAASLLLSQVVSAQTATNDWSALKAVATGSKLSVKLKTGKTVEGRLTGATDEALSLTVKNKPADLKREEVQSVSQVVGKSATKATLIGTGVGAGVGVAVGAAGSSADDGFDKLDKAVTAGLTVIGAGVGAVTGYLIGRRGSKRVLVYEAARP
jgi:hypothetical protein